MTHTPVVVEFTKNVEELEKVFQHLLYALTKLDSVDLDALRNEFEDGYEFSV